MGLVELHIFADIPGTLGLWIHLNQKVFTILDVKHSTGQGWHNLYIGLNVITIPDPICEWSAHFRHFSIASSMKRSPHVSVALYQRKSAVYAREQINSNWNVQQNMYRCPAGQSISLQPSTWASCQQRQKCPGRCFRLLAHAWCCIAVMQPLNPWALQVRYSGQTSVPQRVYEKQCFGVKGCGAVISVLLLRNLSRPIAHQKNLQKLSWPCLHLQFLVSCEVWER